VAGIGLNFSAQNRQTFYCRLAIADLRLMVECARVRNSEIENRQSKIGPAFGVQSPIMIAKDLLEMLVCPADKQPLEHRQNPESLKCTKCHRVYAVKDDIPIMLIDEAVVEP
jgi:uncharacterized protein